MNNKTLTRVDLASAVVREVGLSRQDSAEFVDTILNKIADALVRGESVKLSSFGAFHVRDKNERMGRNPKTGEEVPISARRVVVFKASQVLKDRVDAHNGS
ncbi:MAG: integration host factor subunit alpha [Robiginitomaculum sp.]|nr:integration host factor subunit alpha [Robiginitomaculum sp.]MDQ7079012.1 integration host factor subunit alpha [Robiginitomaculum sp.]